MKNEKENTRFRSGVLLKWFVIRSLEYYAKANLHMPARGDIVLSVVCTIELIDGAVSTLHSLKVGDGYWRERPIRSAIDHSPLATDEVREVEDVEGQLHASAIAV